MEDSIPKRNPSQEFGACEKQGVYDAIYKRRDVRGHFLSDPVPDALLYKLLDAAHHAGSVGFMQPWSFIIIRSEHVKRGVKNPFQEANEAASKVFEGEKREIYSRLKLEGILDSPLNICFTCDPIRNGPHVLGRHTIPETDVYSTCCAVQTFWLAARAEGIGVDWVSVFDPVKLRQVLGIPSHVIPVAYLCVGYASEFAPRPELESAGWLARLPLEELIFYENWGKKTLE